MISEPSVRPMFIRPIVLTRQLLQPSVNFLEPIRTLIVESPSLIPWNSEPENSCSSTTNASGCALAQLAQLGCVADVDDAEGVVFAQTQGDLAIRAFQVHDVQSAAGGALNRTRRMSA